ncbi:hypothetical protein PV10_05663 [Exophiala mesophila]|uniref:SP-RING-type domain-containing protein n=1 Tax=Exophiala mesophila TaxID=212818 RepID=A0A0D1WPX1_EXOME|nr:uncharacterized protein PV10_05663 [Exophiala mesophila]KIV91080.1 hypothetical protein PV10_05663 [Exophiala mesophila]
MAASAYRQSQTHDQVSALVGQIKLLTVDKLKNLLRLENLPVSGVKSELQIRTIAYIEKLRNNNDQRSLERVKGHVKSFSPGYTSNYSNSFQSHTTSSSASSFASPNHHHVFVLPGSTSAPNRIGFKYSPFYDIDRPLTQTLECKAREGTRDTARLTVSLSQQLIDQLEGDPKWRIMVFCASEGFSSLARDADITFPHNVELKCNSDEVKSNLRGLKNKPGSTRPADVTHLIKKKTGYPNTVEMVYALTTKKGHAQKFYLVVNLVRKESIEALVSKIRRGRVITKEQIVREMRSKAEDPEELVATSTVLSLKDPVAYTRIVTPCRGIACNHNQCFDAAAYLQLQEQAPTWTCPICQKSVPWADLALDMYVNDILTSTRRDIDAVTIAPDGKWYIAKNDSTTSEVTGRGNPTPSDEEEDDDDLVEIRDEEPVPPRARVEILTPHSVRTPPLSSREDSRAPSTSAPRSSQKRPRDDFIDLTLSDEEDDGPDPKVQRTMAPNPDTLNRSGPAPDRFYLNIPPPDLPRYNYDRYGSSY